MILNEILLKEIKSYEMFVLSRNSIINTDLKEKSHICMKIMNIKLLGTK